MASWDSPGRQRWIGSGTKTTRAEFAQVHRDDAVGICPPRRTCLSSDGPAPPSSGPALESLAFAWTWNPRSAGMGFEPTGSDTEQIRAAFICETPLENPSAAEDKTAMPDSKAPSPSGSGNNVAWIRAFVDRLAALWSTPRVGRVALCSPLVGVIAGLGAVGFLLALQFMYSAVLGGLLHFHLPPTSEDTPHAVSYPYPW